MTGPEGALDGWKHDSNEAGLGCGMQIPCHGAQCGFCLFDHGNCQQKTTTANTGQHYTTERYMLLPQFHAKTNICQHKTTEANTSNIKECVHFSLANRP